MDISLSFEQAAHRAEKLELLNTIETLSSENADLNQQLTELEAELLQQDAKYQEQGVFYRVFEQLFQASLKPMVLLDRFGTVMLANQKACEYLGFEEPRSTVKSPNFKTFLEMGSRRLFSKVMLQMDRQPNYYDQDLVLILKNGEDFNPSFQAIEANLGSGVEHCVLVSLSPLEMRDMTSHLMRLHVLAFAQIKEGVMITDENQKIIRVNQAFQDITGYTEEEALGCSPAMLSSGRHSPGFYEHMWQHISKHGWWEGEVWNRNKAGAVYPEWLQINRIWDEHTKKLFYIAIFSDITSRKEEHQRLDRLAFFDQLTGLPNREALKNFVESVAVQTAKSQPFALLFLDLDKFKEVNDRFGHPEGDQVLQQAAQRIVASIRDADFAARIGGDEFVVVLSGVSKQSHIKRVLQKLLKVIQQPFEVATNQHYLSVSIGISRFPDDASDQGELLRKADLAMYRAKTLGRDRYFFFDQSLDSESSEASQLQRFVRQAIANFETMVEMHYQPVCHIDPQQAVVPEFECLVRLRRGKELVYPDQFIELCEHSSLIIELGEAIFRKVCFDIQRHGWQNAKFAVNLSAKQFEVENLFEQLQTIAQSYQMTLQNFNFEVTETAITQNLSQMEQTLSALRSEGCEVFLDDFGTGYASLSMLKQLPVDVVKIDRSFVIETDQLSGQEMVKAMVYMAKAMSLKLICEGVETQQQYDWLASIEVDSIQGYLISRPHPLEHFSLANPIKPPLSQSV